MKVQIEIEVPPEELTQASELLQRITTLAAVLSAKKGTTGVQEVATSELSADAVENAPKSMGESNSAEVVGSVLPAVTEAAATGEAAAGQTEAEPGADDETAAGTTEAEQTATEIGEAESTAVEPADGQKKAGKAAGNDTAAGAESADSTTLTPADVSAVDWGEPEQAPEKIKSSLPVIELLEMVQRDGAPAEETAQKIIKQLNATIDYEDIREGFHTALFDPKIVEWRVQKEANCIDVLNVMTFFPVDTRGKLKEDLVATALKVLHVPRNPDCDRMEFFAHAETVAGLVHVGLAPIAAAVKTSTALLKLQNCRCAGVTLLAMTAEHCPVRLRQCQATLVRNLREALARVDSEEFAVELDYINEVMSW